MNLSSPSRLNHRTPGSWPRHRAIPAFGAFVAAAAAFSFGCAGPLPEPRTTADGYRGPGMRVERSEGAVVVVMTAPTPGWELRYDGTREFLGGERIFVTARSPNPQAIYPTRTVEQRVATSSLPQTPVVLYARVLRYDEKARGSHEYSRVLADPDGAQAPGD